MGAVPGLESVLGKAKLAGGAMPGLQSSLESAKASSTPGLDVLREQMCSANGLVGQAFRDHLGTIGGVAREHLSAIKAANVTLPALMPPPASRSFEVHTPIPELYIPEDNGKHLRAIAERGREAMDLQRRQVAASEETLRIAQEERDEARRQRDEARKDADAANARARIANWIAAGSLLATIMIWGADKFFSG